VILDTRNYELMKADWAVEVLEFVLTEIAEGQLTQFSLIE